MKILWLTNIILPKVARETNHAISHVGGWLVGLSEDLLRESSVDLIVCSPSRQINKVVEGEVGRLKYICFPQKGNATTTYQNESEEYFVEMLGKYDVDIIHIFGSEFPQTLAMINASKRLNLLNKVVVNIQGLVSVYANHYEANLPYKVVYKKKMRDYVVNKSIIQQKKDYIKRGRFEIEALSKVKNVIGRTDWDEACTKIINPSVNYYFCNETLRPSFYEKKWTIERCEKYSVFISQSNYSIKGFHIMLEAASIVKQYFPDLKIYTTGNSTLTNTKFVSKFKLTTYQNYTDNLIRKYNLADCIHFLGSLSEQEISERFLNSHVFVSCSSIENSPNSVGEAMLLGVPTISSDVGGIKNMLTHNADGYIYQFDAPYMLAFYIMKIFDNDDIAEEFSRNASKHAGHTHSKEQNLKTLLGIYSIIKNT